MRKLSHREGPHLARGHTTDEGGSELGQRPLEPGAAPVLPRRLAVPGRLTSDPLLLDTPAQQAWGSPRVTTSCRLQLEGTLGVASSIGFPSVSGRGADSPAELGGSSRGQLGSFGFRLESVLGSGLP